MPPSVAMPPPLDYAELTWRRSRRDPEAVRKGKELWETHLKYNTEDGKSNGWTWEPLDGEVLVAPGVTAQTMQLGYNAFGWYRDLYEQYKEDGYTMFFIEERAKIAATEAANNNNNDAALPLPAVQPEQLELDMYDNTNDRADAEPNAAEVEQMQAPSNNNESTVAGESGTSSNTNPDGSQTAAATANQEPVTVSLSPSKTEDGADSNASLPFASSPAATTAAATAKIDENSTSTRNTQPPVVTPTTARKGNQASSGGIWDRFRNFWGLQSPWKWQKKRAGAFEEHGSTSSNSNRFSPVKRLKTSET